MLHGQAFRIISWQPPSRGHPSTPPGDVLGSSMGLSTGNLHHFGIEEICMLVSYENYI